jgi:hypothetical protein
MEVEMQIRGALIVAGLMLAPASNAWALEKFPNLDMRPGCRAAVNAGVGLGRDMDSCLRSEEAARDKLKEGWKNFLPGDRRSCTGMTQMGGPPSYVEVLTCVEMARDVREIRKNQPDPLGPVRPNPPDSSGGAKRKTN